MEINADYVRGYADADGGFNSHIISLHNTDLDLLSKIGVFLSSIGIEYSTAYYQPKGHKKAGRIQITKLKNLLIYADKIGFCMERKQQALEERIKHLCRKGRLYNKEEYEKYLVMKAQGASYRKMSKVLGLSPSTIDRREKRGVYPLDETLFEMIEKIVCKK